MHKLEYTEQYVKIIIFKRSAYYIGEGGILMSYFCCFEMNITDRRKLFMTSEALPLIV